MTGWLTLEAGDTDGGIDGGACPTATEFFTVAATDLSFPDYFGRNWDAFEECLRDAGPVRVRHAERLLADDPTALGTLLAVLRTRAEPVTFTCSADARDGCVTRLREAGLRDEEFSPV